jgi:glucosamine--fructose-6-phosphate aminotransferase (isomerizing)
MPTNPVLSAGSTQHDIASQPAVWQATLEAYRQQAGSGVARLAALKPKRIVVTGCGSTYYLSLSAAAIFRQLGYSAVGVPASELVYFADSLLGNETLLIAVSRSGTTTETLRAVEAYRRRDPLGVVAITTMPDSALAQLADLTLAATAAQETSIAQTKSFTSMFLLSQALAGTLALKDSFVENLALLPGALRQLFERAGDLPRRLGGDLSIERFFFLGGGPFYGLACEAMLKTKEISASWTEAFHPLEFRHGPMSVVDEASLVVGFVSDSAAGAEIDVLRDVKNLGARVWAFVGAGSAELNAMDAVAEAGLALNEWERGALYLPLIQQMACERALAKGLDPDQPKNLVQVIELSI